MQPDPTAALNDPNIVTFSRKENHDMDRQNPPRTRLRSRAHVGLTIRLDEIV